MFRTNFAGVGTVLLSKVYMEDYKDIGVLVKFGTVSLTRCFILG